MPPPRKTARNARIVRLRDVSKMTWRSIAYVVSYENPDDPPITRQRAYAIYKREKNSDG